MDLITDFKNFNLSDPKDTFINGDCMDYLKDFPDNYFDLAIVDPPYGGAGKDVEETFNKGKNGRFGGRFDRYFSNDKRGHMGGGRMKKYGYGTWDIAPDKSYFDELFRVSKNQIVWGGNYFELPPPQDVLWFGIKLIYPKNSQCLCVNTLGLL